MNEIVILSARRTPIGSFQGSLSRLTAPELGAAALAASFESAGVAADQIEQVYMGCVLTAGVGQAPARQAALGAGCPVSTGAVTIGKVCGSAMRSVMSAANDLRCGDFQLVAAGGMESMSNAPYLASGVRDGLRLGNAQLVDSMVHDGLWDPYNNTHMGNCAELCAGRYEFKREAQDRFALESYHRARRATEEGDFDAEIVPVEVKQRKGDPIVVTRDDEPFRVDLDRMSELRPAFQKDGTVTAANSSKINDGAAALVLTTSEHAAKAGLKPMATLVSQATIAQEPEWFTTAPTKAVDLVLERAGLQRDEIDLWEVNEAFAVVAMAFMEELGIGDDRVNVNGGAVALGHPIGASGARIIVTLLHALEQRDLRRGCAAICIGGGESTAVIVDRDGAR